jgi:hypothetical protein
LAKPKVLYIGDSIAANAQFPLIEQESGCRIRTVKAYSSVFNERARFPRKNVTDVTEASIADTKVDDVFTHLVISAPTVDITNLDTTKLFENENVERFKENVSVSCKNIFTVAQNALGKHPKLQKVILVQHPPRYDEPHVDPTQLKPKLAKLANNIYNQLWHSSGLKDKIVIAPHTLDCSDDLIDARYKDDRTGRYDGIHMYGAGAKQAYTHSLLQIFKSFLPSPVVSESSPSFHSTCPQTRFMNSRKKKTLSANQRSNKYSVPTSNKFGVLGN